MKKTILLVLFLVLSLTMEEANADFTFGEPVNLESVIPLIDADHESINCFSIDGLEMYIESDRSGGQGDWDLWVLRRNSVDEDWGPPENLGPNVNSSKQDAAASISSDGLTLHFLSSRAGGNGGQDIYVTTRLTKNTPWEQAMNIGSEINSSSNDSCPWLSPDGLELYFDSRRPDGFGSYDLWVTTRATTGDTWGEPVNLGPMINSAYSDCNISLSPDGRVLFFSGNQFATIPRPGGYGGSDIWMTKRETLSDPWQAPVNLGPKVNNSAHEIIPRISPDGSTLYFCTNSGNTWNNWQAPIIPIVDLNSDGIVDCADMCIIVDNWGTDNQLCDVGPMPWGDGVVDVEDLIVLAEHLFEEFPSDESVE